MPKLTRLRLDEKRAVNRLQISGAVPSQQLRLKPGHWVRIIRCALHMTQRQLALRAGVSQGNLALLEKGHAEPQLETVRRLFDALGCDLAVLPIPRRQFGEMIAEKTLGVPRRRVWD